MQEIHTILIGLENTLLNQFGDIPPATMSVLQDLHSKGVLLALTSTRSADWVIRFLKRKRIDDLFSFILAAGGGQYVSLAGDGIRDLAWFTKDQASKLIEKAIHRENSSLPALEHYPVTYALDTGSRYVYERPGYYSFFYELCDHTLKPDFHGMDSISDDIPIRRIFLLGSRPILTTIQDSQVLEIIPKQRPFKSALMLFPPEASYLKALEIAKAEFHLDEPSIMTFGSTDLDAPLIGATWGIAMKNSSPEAKEKARRITKYNSGQNGIAYMINVLLMEKTCVFRSPQKAKEKAEAAEEKNTNLASVVSKSKKDSKKKKAAKAQPSQAAPRENSHSLKAAPERKRLSRVARQKQLLEEQNAKAGAYDEYPD